MERQITWRDRQYELARDTHENGKVDFAIILIGTHTEIKVKHPEDATRIFRSLINAKTEIIQ